jgi:hypothetical protein
MTNHLRRGLHLFVALSAAFLLHGCAMQAGNFAPSIDNVEVLKRSGAAGVALGSFAVRAGMDGASSISLRGNPMASPVGPDYAAYLGDALRQELLLAGKLDPRSDIVISGTLLRNDIAAGGISTKSGEVEARFVVRRGDQLRYEGSKRVQLSWESSFAGAVAVPKAQQQYPVLVQQLLAQLYADAQFMAALR